MMEVAQVMAQRATCMVRKVGCVITDEGHHILATGYNGQPHGMTHCTDLFPCDAWREGEHVKDVPCLAIHAEINALLRCTDVDKIFNTYVTVKPCLKCSLALANTRCQYVVYPGDTDMIISHPLEIANGYLSTPYRF